MASCLEFEAKAVDKAVQKASEALNIPKEDLNYNVISYGSSGIFGLVGVKKAKICVTLPEEPVGRKERGNRKRNGKKKPGPLSPMHCPPIFRIPRPRTVSPPWCRRHSASRPEPAPADATLAEDPIELGKDILQRIIDFITTGATISVEEQKERIRFDVRGGNPGVLIGKRGQTLEAIQYIVEKIVNKHHTERIRIQVDVEGYLDARKANLESLARRFAEKTRHTGKPSTIGPMNAHDRRIIHLTLKDDNRVRTQSIGEGFYRKLVIFPRRKRSS